MNALPALEPVAVSPPAQTRARYPWPALLGCVAALVVPAGFFAARQTLWLDETTQLSGLQLSPVQVTLWLAGAPHDFGYPTAPDRMPPLSYWLGHAWAGVFGPGELAQRWFGIACVALAVAVVFETGRRAFGTASGVAAALLVGLSGSIIERAVEIRAYPLYLLTAACGYYGAVRWLREGKQGWLWVMALAVILTMYTHFHGVVFAAMLLAGLLAARRRQGGAVRPVVAAGLVIATAGLGLLPFVTASMDVSRYGASWTLQDKLLALGGLGWSFVGHRILASSMLGALGGAAAFTLLTIAAWHARPRGSPVTLALAVALGLGLLSVTGATFVLTVFKPALFQYNLWMVPAAALLLASGMSSPQPRARWAARLAATLVLITQVVAAVALATAGQKVAHGPDPALAATIARLGPRQVTAFHDGGSGAAWVQVYYPLCYRLRGMVRQYQYDEQAGDFAWLDDGRVRLQPADAPTRYVIVVRSGPRTTMPWAVDQAQAFADGPATRALLASPRWRVWQRWVYAAGMKMNIYIFEREAAAP